VGDGNDDGFAHADYFFQTAPRMRDFSTKDLYCCAAS
jgi:hypothetical protein